MALQGLLCLLVKEESPGCGLESALVSLAYQTPAAEGEKKPCFATKPTYLGKSVPGDSRLVLLHAEKVTGDSPSMAEVRCLRLDSLGGEPKEGCMCI